MDNHRHRLGAILTLFACPWEETNSIIVIYRNGVPTVITGWRAWLIMLSAALAFVVIAGLALGLH